jgi:hypothetical protein
MRFIASDSILTQRHTVEVPAGQYEEFLIFIKGTNNAGETVTLGNMNNLRLNRNGHDFINANFDNLATLSDLHAGMIAATSGAGAAFEHAFHVPCYVGNKNEFPNVLNVADEDVVKFHLDFGALAVPVANGAFYIYGVIKSGVENYLPIIAQDSIVLAAAGAYQKRKAPIVNVHSAYFFPSTAANLAKVTVERDDIVIEDSNYDALQVYTNISNRKEANALELGQAKLSLAERADELLSESIYVTPLSQTGAVTVEIIYTGAIFDAQAKNNSLVTRDARIQRNAGIKRAAGKNDADILQLSGA